jgi:serine/threonine protein kinase
MTELRDRLQESLGTTYTIERELGGGGMSRVFVAVEIALARRVVVKVLPAEIASGVSVERFRREIPPVPAHGSRAADHRRDQLARRTEEMRRSIVVSPRSNGTANAPREASPQVVPFSSDPRGLGGWSQRPIEEPPLA